MNLPGKPESYWVDTTPATSYPEVEADTTVDVAVIGGGIAGLCTAWELVKAGRQVAVLEAERIVSGVTGYTTAKVTSLHTLIYAELARSDGDETARLYATSQQDAVENVARTADELSIDCDLERLAAYTYTETATEADQIRAEVAAAAKAGLAASFVTETGLPFPVAAAIRVDDQVQFHPRRYLLALATAITAAGGSIFENTRVIELEEGAPCGLVTATGQSITAGEVVVATHYPVFDRGLLFTRLKPHRDLVLAAPIPAAKDPQGMYITRAENLRSVRTAPLRDGERLLIVTGEAFEPGAGEVGQRFERLAGWMRDRFGVNEITYRWAAQDNRTSDHLPFVGPIHVGAKHTWVATGFGGWGMSNGVMAGRLLAASITGDPLPWARLYDPRRLHPLREAGPLISTGVKVAGHFVGDRLRGSQVKSTADIEPGGAAVLRVDGERCAAYRDRTGLLHTVSATCTHMGCVVAFNDAEQAWECPCHGSRFSVDGDVLHGPANRPLQARGL